MKENCKKHIFVVLGMHRSGTSAITRGLKVLGVDLGDKLMQPNPYNEKGYWEDLDINNLNIDLLNAIGYDWHTLTPINPEDILHITTDKFKLRAVEILRYKLSRTDYFGFKDPRLSRLLPFWKSVFEHLNVRVSYIIANRNPLSVARSLSERDNFDFSKSYYLWFEHSFASLSQTKLQRRIVVDYDLLIENPLRQLKRIAICLGLKFDQDSKEFTEYQTDFINVSLRHVEHALEDLKLDTAVPPCVIELYQVLTELALDNIQTDDSKVHLLIESYQQQLKENYAALRYMQICEDRKNEAEKKMIEKDHQIENNIKSIIENKRQINLLEKTLIENKRQINLLEKTLIENKRQINLLEKTLSERDQQVLEITESKKQQVKDLQNKIEVLNITINKLKNNLGKVISDYQSILKSTSWRITLPLRIFSRHLQRSFRTCHNLIRRRIELKLEPAQQIRRNHNEFVSLGNDPYFILKPSTIFSRFPGGLCIVSYKGCAEKRPLSPILYVNDGRGYSESGSYALPITNGKPIEHLISLPYNIKTLRLDPIDFESEFKLDYFVIVEKNGLLCGNCRILTHIRVFFYRFLNLLFPIGTRRRIIVSKLKEYQLYICRLVYGLISRKGIQPFKTAIIHALDPEYEDWIKRNEPTVFEMKSQHKNSKKYNTKISICAVTFNPNGPEWKRTLSSVYLQTYKNWEICAVAIVPNHVPVAKLQQFTGRDKRMRFIYLDKFPGEVRALNKALEIADGDFVAMLCEGDTLSPFALYQLVEHLHAYPEADFIYTDEDEIHGIEAFRMFPKFKPGWSPDTLASGNYIGQAFYFSKELIQRIGHLREEHEGQHFYDWLLLATENAKCITHLPHVHFHFCEPHIVNAKAQNPFLLNDGEMLRQYINKPVKIDCKNLKIPPDKSFKFSLCILNKNAPEYIIPLLDKLRQYQRNNYYEIIVGDTGSTDQDVLSYYNREQNKIRIIIEKKYHFGKNYNWLVSRYAQGEFIVFLNNDIILQNLSFLENIEKCFYNNDIGVMGHKLLYPDNRIQHGGVFIFEQEPTRGLPYHRMHGKTVELLPDAGLEFTPAVTGAFFICRRNDFIKIDGFDEEFEEEVQDIDLCLKFRRQGKKVGFLNESGIYHIENGTRPRGSENWHDRNYYLWKWNSFLEAQIIGTELNNAN